MACSQNEWRSNPKGSSEYKTRRKKPWGRKRSKWKKRLGKTLQIRKEEYGKWGGGGALGRDR